MPRMRREGTGGRVYPPGAIAAGVSFLIILRDRAVIVSAMEKDRVATLRRQIELYRQCLRRTSGADVAAIYLRELAAAECELAELDKSRHYAAATTHAA